MVSPLALDDSVGCLDGGVAEFFAGVIGDLREQMILALKKVKGPDGKVLTGDGAGYVLPSDNQRCGYCNRRGHAASTCSRKAKDDAAKAKKARLASTFPSPTGEPATTNKWWQRIKNLGGFD